MKLLPSELFKSSRRLDLLIEKYSHGDPFELVRGGQIKFSFSTEIYETLKRKDIAEYRRLLLYDEAGNSYRLSDLQKTTEFGGKEKGFCTRIEDWEITSLNYQIKSLTNSSLPLRIGDEVKEIIRVESTKGTPKSDFHFIDKFEKEVFWCSHKKGNSPKDFQQWGGVTEDLISSHKETIDFVETVRSLCGGTVCSGTLLGRRIEDSRLKCLSVFGIDYGKSFGIQNVTILLQGEVKLEALDNTFSLHTNHIHLNSELPNGEYDPIFIVRYTEGRMGFGIENARFMIIPYGGKNIKGWI